MNKKNKIKKKLEDKLKKSWWDKMFNKNKFQKLKKVAVIYLRENGNAEPMELESKNGFFHIEGRTYHERRDCIYTVGKERIPLAIIPEWSMTPLGTKQWDEKLMQEKFSEVQDHLLKGIRHAELVRMGEKDGMNINVKKAIGIGIIVLVAIVIIVSYI